MNSTKKIVLIFMCSHFLTNGPLNAQSHDEDIQAISSAMSALDKFMAAFNSRDMQAWAATLNLSLIHI